MSTPIRQLFDLSGKTALVTGGSRGLGLQIAEALGEAGARVLLTSRKAADLEESAAHLKAEGHRGDLGRRRSQPAERDRPRHAGCDGAPRPRRHPRQQRRRHVGRSGRGPSARGLGQGDEPQRALDLPDEPGDRQAQHDPEEERQDHQHRVDRRPGRQQRRHVDGRLQHEQGGGRQLHAHARRRMGQVQHQRQRPRAGDVPEQDDQGNDRADRRRRASPATRRCCASATTTT